TVTKLNYMHIKETTDICFKAGADNFVIFRYIPEGRKNKELMLSIENLKTVTGELLQIQEDYPNTAVGFENLTFFPHLIDPAKIPSHKCNAGIDVLNITSNGDVTPCPHARNFIIGNLNNQPLQDLWNEWLKRVDTFHTPPTPPKECLQINCEFLRYCNGGCRGSGVKKNVVANIDPYCWKISQVTKTGTIESNDSILL
ncbi:SPASM domain-containing protein, partial [Dehalococcoidia bacterium]|nr:SPASM domain-containing protein [Dehalococcoidia bacterium]